PAAKGKPGRAISRRLSRQRRGMGEVQHRDSTRRRRSNGGGEAHTYSSARRVEESDRGDEIAGDKTDGYISDISHLARRSSERQIPGLYNTSRRGNGGSGCRAPHPGTASAGPGGAMELQGRQ